MKIRPDRDNPKQFVISDISDQELQNFINMIESSGWNITPWGKYIMAKFKLANESNTQFFYNTEW